MRADEVDESKVREFVKQFRGKPLPKTGLEFILACYDNDNDLRGVAAFGFNSRGKLLAKLAITDGGSDRILPTLFVKAELIARERYAQKKGAFYDNRLG